jgi:4-amino-4-deoxy-L-arabinose transferase-like glycosyltransferase
VAGLRKRFKLPDRQVTLGVLHRMRHDQAGKISSATTRVKLSLQQTADYKATNASVKPAAVSRLNRVPEAVPLAALAAALIFVVLFWRLGIPTFWDPDEAHYAQTAREMMTSGDWWAPYFNEEPFFDKPVLFHQLQSAAMLVFGPTEFAARLVPALASLALIVITVWFGTRTISRDVGITAGLLLTASPGVFALSRYAILDTLFTAAVFGGAALIAVAALRNAAVLQWWGYVAVGLSVLVKGPVAFVFCGLTLIVASLVSADARRRLLGLHWLLGLLLATAIALPWFVYMVVRFGEAFVNGYFFDENLRLFAGRRFANQPRPWFYFQILAAGLLPWSGLVAGRLVDDVRAALRRETVDTLEILLWSWTAAIVGFFTLSTFKLDHYVFPAAPALCLLCARAWSDVRADPLDPRHRGARAGLHLVGPLLVVLGLGCGYFVVARLELPRVAVVVPIAVTLAGALLAAIVNVQGRAGRRPPRYPWIALTTLLVTYTGIIAFVLPALEARKVVPDVARWVAANAGDDVRIASYRLNRWNSAYRFYVNRHVALIDDPREAEEFFRSPQPFYCAMRRAAYQAFVARGIPLTIVYQRDGMWATSGRVLWRRRITPERFVVVSRAR